MSEVRKADVAKAYWARHREAESALAVFIARSPSCLIRASKSRGGGYWSDDDYDVRDGNRVIGRIMLHPQAPKDQPWFWTITAREAKPSIYNISGHGLVRCTCLLLTQSGHGVVHYRRPLPNLYSTSISIGPTVSPRSRLTSSRTARRVSSGRETNACPGEPPPCSNGSK